MEVKIRHLRCEYLENPLGIDTPSPRLSWKLYGSRRGLSQTAYQIQCAETEDFTDTTNLLWDSGKVESDSSIQIKYSGSPLQSRQRVFWRVMIWDETNSPIAWSKIVWWEMGLLDSVEWRAAWIEPEGDINPEELQPVAYLRKEFEIGEEIANARLYITTHGVYNTYINGSKVGDLVFMPGITSYDTRLQYQVYDITSYLKVGMNCIGVEVGDGWWRGSTMTDNLRNTYGEKLGLLLQLEVGTSPGNKMWITSDASWQSTCTGPYRSSDLKFGDEFDGRLLIQGWESFGFDTSNWDSPKEVTYAKGNLIGTMGVPVREKERFHPSTLTTPDGSMVLDFAQNIAGYIECHFKNLPDGHEICLEFGEVLDKEGNFTQSNFEAFRQSTQIQRDRYIHGGKDYLFKNKFSLKGFRYVKITGLTAPPDPSNFTAIAIYSDLEQTGEFTCSDERVNRLVVNARWSQKGNFLDIPTDCPTRERAGWTGDAQIFCYAGSLLMNIAPLYNKWMKDVSAEQRSDGGIINITPSKPQGKLREFMNKGAAGWGDAATIIPSTLWKIFGDVQQVSERYESAKKWVECERARARRTNLFTQLKPQFWVGELRRTKKFIWDTGFQWGEWLEAESDTSESGMGKELQRSIFLGTTAEIATAYYYYSATNLAMMAKLLEKTEDAALYSKLAEKIKQAYQLRFLKTGVPLSERQAVHVRPVALGLVEGNKAKRLISVLNEKIKQRDYHLGTGFLSTPFILPVLSDYGYLETAYKLLLQTTSPSWLYQITKGATTIWERWDGIDESGQLNGSHNHYSYGAVVSWLFDTVCGIQNDPENPGYRHFFLAPKPGGELSFAHATYNSMYGEISSSWKKSPDKGIIMEYEFKIPPNTWATVMLETPQNCRIIREGEELTVCNGVIGLIIEEKNSVVEIQSGNYVFQVSPN